MITVFAVFIIVILIVIDRWKSKRFMEIHKELGNDTLYLPIIGHAYIFMGNNEDIMDTFERASWQTYGRKYGAASMWMGHKLMILIADPIVAATALKTTHSKDFIHSVIKHLLGNGTVFTSPEYWQRRRKILAPSFSSRFLSKFICIFEANSKVIAEKFETKVENGNFSSFDYFCPYALDSLCETALGVNINIQNDPEHDFFTAFKNYFSNVATRICQPWLRIDALYKFLPDGERQERNKKIMYQFIDDLINKKKALIQGEKKVENSDNATMGRADIKTFLELMIEISEQTDKGYTHEELREEILTLALAGTDTSAAGACFTLVMLSQHPDVQEKVYQEILDVFEDPDKPIEMADLQKLKYMDAVIKETLRLYPPVPVVSRRTTSEVELSPGLVIPPGVEFVIHIWGIHRNPYYWGADAKEFKPERFLLEPFPVISSAFLPFSNGPRNCIGYQYALLSMKTTLTILLRKYRLLPATSFKYDTANPLKCSFQIMMKHVNNYEIRVEYRNKNDIKIKQ